jgi:hypothetical protein
LSTMNENILQKPEHATPPPREKIAVPEEKTTMTPLEKAVNLVEVAKSITPKTFNYRLAIENWLREAEDIDLNALTDLDASPDFNTSKIKKIIEKIKGQTQTKTKTDLSNTKINPAYIRAQLELCKQLFRDKLERSIIEEKDANSQESDEPENQGFI